MTCGKRRLARGWFTVISRIHITSTAWGNAASSEMNAAGAVREPVVWLLVVEDVVDGLDGRAILERRHPPVKDRISLVGSEGFLANKAE